MGDSLDLKHGKGTAELSRGAHDPKGRQAMQRRVGTINCHVCVEGNARQVGHVAREVARLDVCVITETWLKEEQVDMVRLVCNQSGYDWISEERSGQKGGGVGIMIKHGLRWEKVKSTGDRILWVQVEGIGYLGAVYLPPAGSSSTTAEFHRMVSLLALDAKELMKSAQVIVAGDFNARVGELHNEVEEIKLRTRSSEDKVITTRGRFLLRAMNQIGLYLSNGVGSEAGLTFGRNGEGSVIDMVWCCGAIEAGLCEEWSDASAAMSDHVMVVVPVQGYVVEMVETARKPRWRKVGPEWKLEGMERWREWQQDKQGVSAVEMWKSWRGVLEEEAVVRVGKEVPRLMKHHEGEWSEEVKQLVMLSGVMRKRGESVKGITKTIKKAKVRARISARSRRNEDIANERKTNPRRYWFKLNQWLGKQKRGMPSVITYEGKEVKGCDKLRAWRQMFQGDSMQAVDEDVEVWIRSRNTECELRSGSQYVQELDQEIRWLEVERAVKQLKSGKAPGEDGVIAELLKGASVECIRALGQVFARCFEQEEIPEEWARGLIVPIPKNAEVRKVENYRGITLLSIVGKVYVAVLNDRLKRWMESSKVVVEEQAGFREGYSPVDQVYVLSEIIQRQKRKKKPWYCAFLDIKRAYDVVWREALWERLWICGVRGKMWRVIRKLYAKTESCVLVEDQRTEWSRCDVGVRQGCVMSPNLFSLFINGMAEDIKSAAKGIVWADKKVSLLMFADDVVLLAEEEKDMETMLEVAHRYSRRWRFQFNAAKCKVMANRKRSNGVWTIGGEPMAEVESFVYLGVEFGKRKGSKEMKSRCCRRWKGGSRRWMC